MDDDNIEQASYLYGFDAGERSISFKFKLLLFLVGMLLGVLYQHWWLRWLLSFLVGMLLGVMYQHWWLRWLLSFLVGMLLGVMYQHWWLRWLTR